MTQPDWERSQRRTNNERSKSWASRNKEPWTDDDDIFLLDEWISAGPKKRDEILISQLLARTIESCRVRCEHIRDRLGIKRETEPAKPEPPYLGLEDDPEDQWWSPGYYNNGGGSHA